MTIPPGVRLGFYEVLAPIGAGGMGEVYRAHDTKLGRDVAIKVLPEAFAHDPDKLSRFDREARMLAALNHPNIAAIYGLEESAGTSYLVMELVPGETLAERIKRGGAIPVEETLAIAKQIAEALEAAHEKGIVHRDLKPANVKVTPEGKVKVLDFGLAKAFTDESASQDLANSPTLSAPPTMQGVILGTAAYMSPEQARGKSVDRRADIWAFGVVLYEMLAGQQLFAGETVTDTLAQVITKEPPWDKVPARMRPLLHWCLEKDPRKRLRDIADGMALTNVAPEQKVRPQSAISAPNWLWGISAAACLVAAGLALVLYRQKPLAAPEAMRFQIKLPEKVNFTLSAGVSLSPDGRHVAFSAAGPDDAPPRVWIQDLDAEEAHAIPDTATGPEPPPFFWSPASRYVVYSENSTKLKKADLSNGTLQDICDKPSPPVGGSWNRDGVIIFGGTTTGLWRVAATGGTPVPLTSLDASRNERQHELPQFLPDGRHFIYLRASTTPGDTGIYVGSLDDAPDRQSRKQLVATGFGAVYASNPDSKRGRLLFMRDGNLLAQTFDEAKLELIGEPSPIAERIGTAYETGYYSASSSVLTYRAAVSARSYQLTWFDAQGKVIGKVGAPGVISGPRISPDGTRAIYVKDALDRSEADLWMIDLARDASQRFTFGPGLADFPAWSPDGKDVVFAWTRERRWNLYRKPANGSREEELLLQTDENLAPSSWSRDGRFLIYSSSETPNFVSEDLWVLPMQGDHKPFPFLRTRFNEGAGQFSPDGHWIAYRSNESGRSEVYVREFTASGDSTEAGGKWIVSKDGGYSPRWRADGKEIMFIGPNRRSILTVSVDTSHSFQAGVPRELFQLPPGTNGADSAPDLKRFLAAVPEEQKSSPSFTVVLNWATGMKQ